MTEELAKPGAAEFVAIDPYGLARRERAATRLKRFYAQATVAERDGAFLPLLDGQPLKSPARQDVALPSRAAADAVADEWNLQGEIIQPGNMPITRLINTAIDGVARSMADVQAEILRFAGTDLLCYRAEAPPELIERQAREWDPVLAWGRAELGGRLYLAQGVMFVAQPDHALTAIDQAVAASVGTGPAAPFRLAALHVMTTLCGSALLGLAVARGALTVEDAWRKAHVDEDFQIERWGEDHEAAQRRQRRWTEMRAAARLFVAVA